MTSVLSAACKEQITAYGNGPNPLLQHTVLLLGKF